MINESEKRTRFDAENGCFTFTKTVSSAEERAKYSNDPWAVQDVEWSLSADLVCRMADWLRRKYPDKYPVF